MSIAAQYAQAMVPDRWRIFGRRLRPLCIGHAILLQRIGNGFDPEGDGDPGIADVIVAVAICSKSFEAGARCFKSKAWLRGMRRYARIISWIDALTGGMLLLTRVQMWRQYYADGLRRPPMWSTNGRKIQTSRAQILKVSMMANFGKTESAALNTPLAVAAWDHCCLIELNGQKVIQGDEDQTVIERAKAMAREMARN